MNYVYDTSFIGPLIVKDEKNPKVDKAHAAIGEDDEIFVPQLFWYEISNLFKNLLRRNRYTYENVIPFYQPLAAIRLNCDNATGIEYSKKLLSLCNAYNLSSYDAAYLELAERKKAVLCTMDDKLRAAAKKHGVTVLK